MTGSPATASNTTPLTPDICVIGGGAAGLSLATAAALFGVSVVLVERDRLGGGKDAVISNALIAASTRARLLHDAGHFGIAAAALDVEFAKVQAHIAGVVAALAPNETAERLAALGVTLINGEARFRDRNTVQVGDREIRARRFVIATGSRPAAPSIPGLDKAPVLTVASVLTLNRRPERLIVLGCGSEGVELAQAMHRLGSSVTIVGAEDLLADEDPEAVMLIRRALLRDGIALHERAKILRVETPRNRVRLVLAGTKGEAELPLDGTHLLIASDRQPAIAALDLELAGIASDAGGIVVNKGLRTANRRVFAIGGCASGNRHSAHLGHAASHQASLVLRNILFRLPVKTDAAALPRVTSCEPELASIGLSEEQAHRAAREIRILRWPYAESDKAQAERQTEGFVKLITDGKGRVLGATIIGAKAGELIAPWCLAIEKGLNVKDMAGLVLPSSTFSELSKRAALSVYSPLASRPGIRRLIGFLRRFG